MRRHGRDAAVSVRVRFPGEADLTVADLLAGVEADAGVGPLAVGDERVVDFLAALGQRLGRPSVARRHPELGALGFFLRRTAVLRAISGSAPPPGTLRFPRGLVFQVAPSNVDVLFGYSWALSMLAGNRNVVRVSTRAGPVTTAMLDLLNETAADGHSTVAGVQRVITYEHDDAVTSALSAACDLRVVWGGDTAVDRLRRFPLGPAARDLTFPDRSSFAVISAAGWLSTSPTRRRHVAEGLSRDVFWFDQAACASPRAIYLIGTEWDARTARDQIADELEAVGADRPLDTSMAIGNMVSAYSLAASGVAERVRFPGGVTTHVDLAATAIPPREWLGAGMFVWGRLGTLDDLVPILKRRDQTVTHFGFEELDLVAFARSCGGRSVDRIVPIGQALTFSTVWDGLDLMREYTRLTVVDVAGSATARGG
jgi:hypothetical protein